MTLRVSIENATLNIDQNNSPLSTGNCSQKHHIPVDVRQSNPDLQNLVSHGCERGNDQWIELRPTALIKNRETLLDGNGKLRKDDYAKEIAQRDGITQGLICVLRILEPCQSVTMVPGGEAWWDFHRHRYDLVTAQYVVDECNTGNQRFAAERLEDLAQIPLLSLGEDIDRLATEIISHAILPADALLDALHIACAAVNRVDYLLTWNYRLWSTVVIGCQKTCSSEMKRCPRSIENLRYTHPNPLRSVSRKRKRCRNPPSLRPSSASLRAPGPASEGMVWIPGGEFSMGSDAESESLCSLPGVTRDAIPIHRVAMDGFWMDATEVTNGQYAQFVKTTGYVTVAEQKPTQEEFPTALPENLIAGSTRTYPT
ncbi:MAG: SUMF1/EgtB/PvdO family nonheme iron enzyme, partial [Planctomycetaceae bacterium]